MKMDENPSLRHEMEHSERVFGRKRASQVMTPAFSECCIESSMGGWISMFFDHLDAPKLNLYRPEPEVVREAHATPTRSRSPPSGSSCEERCLR